MERAVPVDAGSPNRWILDQQGEMELRPGRWGSWRAEEEFAGGDLGFEWRGWVRVGPMVWMRVRDGYGDGVGWGRARVWGVVPVINERGAHIARAQLVRNLTDLPFAPHVVAAGGSLGWKQEGEEAATLHVPVGDREVAVRFRVDERGDVLATGVPDRPRNLPGRKGLVDTPYRVVFGEHAQVGGVRIPTRAEAYWDLSEGPRLFNRVEVIGASRT